MLGPGRRLLLESAFLVALAVMAGLAELTAAQIIGVMALGWGLTALVELVSWQLSARRSARRVLVREEPVAPSMAEAPVAAGGSVPAGSGGTVESEVEVTGADIAPGAVAAEQGAPDVRFEDAVEGEPEVQEPAAIESERVPDGGDAEPGPSEPVDVRAEAEVAEPEPEPSPQDGEEREGEHPEPAEPLEVRAEGDENEDGEAEPSPEGGAEPEGERSAPAQPDEVRADEEVAGAEDGAAEPSPQGGEAREDEPGPMVAEPPAQVEAQEEDTPAEPSRAEGPPSSDDAVTDPALGRFVPAPARLRSAGAADEGEGSGRRRWFRRTGRQEASELPEERPPPRHVRLIPRAEEPQADEGEEHPVPRSERRAGER